MLVVEVKHFPIRCAAPAAGYGRGPSNGVYGSRCADERLRTCLLPDDEGPMWATRNVGVTWLLLPENAAKHSD